MSQAADDLSRTDAGQDDERPRGRSGHSGGSRHLSRDPSAPSCRKLALPAKPLVPTCSPEPCVFSTGFTGHAAVSGPRPPVLPVRAADAPGQQAHRHR